jgi:DNA-binding NtrC family response regulator
VLIEHFVRRFASGREMVITPDDMSLLRRHSWPGNVRELRNTIERAVLLAKGEAINLEDALHEEPAPTLGIRTDLPFKEAKGQLVEKFEREYIEDLMKRHKMNLSAAAREAQIDRKHLRELIRKYDLDPRKD